MIRTFVAICASLCLCARALGQAPDWEYVGPPGISAAHVTGTRIAFNSGGLPYVVYQDLQNNVARASVQRLGPGGWEYVGAQYGASLGTAWYNQIEIDAEGNVFVATRDYAFGGRINLRKFPAGGSAWSSVGQSGFSASEAHYTAVALRSDGTPFVVYADRSTTPPDRASSMSFENGVWGFVGGQGLSPLSAGFTSIELDPQDRPYVGYSDAGFLDPSNAGKGTVMRFDPATGIWTRIGPPGFTASGAQNATVAIDREGVPWFVYHQYHQRIVVLRFDGAQWVQVGGQANGPDQPGVETEPWRQWLSLRFDSQNTPYVAYQLQSGGLKAAVRRFDGSSWVPVGSIGFTPGAADYLSLAIDPFDVPWVVFRDAANSGRVSVMRFAPSPSKYCESKPNSLGCLARITLAGNPSLTGATTCSLQARDVITHKVGALLYGFAPAHTPFFGGILCIGTNIQRTPAQNSGGAAGVDDCSGTYAYDFDATLQAPGAAFAVGQHVYAQYWYRDPLDPFAVGLSDAVRMTIGP